MENYQKNIVDPKYVYEKLDAKNFKVIDCTVYFELKKVGASTIHSGYEDYLKRHIPGSAYLHMVDDLSEKDNPIPFSIVSQEKLNEKLSSIGINNEDEISRIKSIGEAEFREQGVTYGIGTEQLCFPGQNIPGLMLTRLLGYHMAEPLGVIPKPSIYEME